MATATTPPRETPAGSNFAYDVTAAVQGNPAFQIRWGYAVLANGSWVVGGWNVDEVRIVPGQGCP